MGDIFLSIRRFFQGSVRDNLGKKFEKILNDMDSKYREKVLLLIDKVDRTGLPLEKREELLLKEIQNLIPIVLEDKIKEMVTGNSLIATSCHKKNTYRYPRKESLNKWSKTAKKIVKDALKFVENYPYEYVDEILDEVERIEKEDVGYDFSALCKYENDYFPAWYIGRYTLKMFHETISYFSLKDVGFVNYKINPDQLCPYKEHQQLKGLAFPLKATDFLFPCLQFGCSCWVGPVLGFEEKPIPKFDPFVRKSYKVDLKSLSFKHRRIKPKQ